MSRRYDDWLWDNLDTLTERFIKENNAEDVEDHEEYIGQHYGAWEDWVWEQFIEQ